MFLSSDELRELTGYVMAAKQAAWLRDHRWRHHVNARGEVCVAKAYFERRMVGEVTSAEPSAEPDFSAVR